jgi:WD40 repeat protein/tetratricopeptide (TPR) repeat protein
MNERARGEAASEERIGQVLGGYLEALETGQAPELSELLARHPELAGELAAFFAQQEQLQQMVAPLRAAAEAARGAELTEADPEATISRAGPSDQARSGEEVPVDPGETVSAPPPPERGGADGDGGGAGGDAGDGDAGEPLPRGSRVRYFGDYELKGVLGQGGMGIVYRARQLSLNRPVALKMIRAGIWADEDEVRRFRNEAEAIANLDHPRIVTIHEVGQYQGRHYFSMKLVEGPSLDQRLGDYAAAPRAAARLVAEVARAVHHAHQRGILHRDLKPSNILLDPEGHPHVTDFGLARRIGGDGALSLSGSILGTPQYMSPEQAAGQRRAITTATDVYGLGAILYATLTGKPPFQSDSVAETLEQVRGRAPEPPSKLNQRVPRDLEVICLKCLEKDPHRRYDSAAAVADDLGRFLGGEPIQARRVSQVERLVSWCRRNPRLAGAVGAAAAALVAVAVLSVLYAAGQARYAAGQARAVARIAHLAAGLETEGRRTKAEAERVTRALIESNRRLAILNFERGQSACEQGEIGPGLLWTVESLRAATAASDAAWQQIARANLSAWLPDYPKLKAVFSHDGRGRVDRVAFSPDGKTVLTGSWDGTARLWDNATGRPIGPPLQHQEGVSAVAFSPDSKTALTGSRDHTARLWDAVTGQPIGPPLRHQGDVLAVAFSPDGKIVLTGSWDHTARLWDAATGQPLGKPLQHQGGVPAVAFSPDGKSLLSGSWDHTARLWDVATGRPLTKPLHHSDVVGSVAISPDGKSLLIGCRDGAALLWDAATGRLLAKFLHHQSWVFVAFSPDGKTLLTGSEDRTARLWDVATGRPIGKSVQHQGAVYAVAFSPDGKTVLTGGVDGTARLWDAVTGRPVGKTLSHQGGVYAVAFSPDGKSLLTGSFGFDKTARLWDAAAGQAIGRPLDHPGAVNAVAFSPDGKTVLAGCSDGTARLWDAATGRPLAKPLHHQGAVNAVAFSPDGKTLLTGCEDKTARLWDAATGRPLAKPLHHQGPVRSVAYSPDGKSLLTGGEDGTARLWETATGRPLGPPMQHQGAVNVVAYSPGGKTLFTGCFGFDETARLWDVATGRPLGKPFHHQGQVLSVAFSPDGKSLFTGGEDGTALWDVATGRPLDNPFRHQGQILSVAFSPDGKTALTGSFDKTARLWDVATGRPLGKPFRHQGPILSVAFSPDGKSLLTGSDDRTVRLWRLTNLPDDLPRLSAWIDTVTGLELDEQGGIRVLSTAQWAERRQRLSQLGGPPDTGQGGLLDPILFGDDPTARARSLTGLGRWSDAEAAFAEAVAARPEVAALWIERGQFYITRSQPEKAAADFARALDLVPADRSWSSPRSAMILNLARSDQAYAELLRLRPNDGHLWTGRGRYHALRSRWDQSVADFARGIASAPSESEEWFEHACLRLIVGDTEGYRNFVQEMRRAGRTEDPFVAYVLARTCILSPDPVVEPERVVRWAEQAVASDNKPWYPERVVRWVEQVASDKPKPWYLHALGAAHYRAGHLDEAAKRLEESNAGTWTEEGKAQNRLVLAMVYQRLGETAKARAELNGVMEWWKRLEAAKTEDAVAIPTSDWLPLQILRREAEAVVLYDPAFPTDPFAR